MNQYTNSLRNLCKRPIIEIESKFNNEFPYEKSFLIFDLKKKQKDDLTIYRVYLAHGKLDPISFVGWVCQSNINNCMVCNISFSRFKRRHHCRSCGDLICSSCSILRTINDYFVKLPVRVCRTCHIKSPNGSVLLNQNFYDQEYVSCLHKSLVLIQERKLIEFKRKHMTEEELKNDLKEEYSNVASSNNHNILLFTKKLSSNLVASTKNFKNLVLETNNEVVINVGPGKKFESKIPVENGHQQNSQISQESEELIYKKLTLKPHEINFKILPCTGIVLKLKTLDDQKVFINLCHSHLIEDPNNSLIQPSNTTNLNDLESNLIVPIFYYSEKFIFFDSSNNPSSIYNIVISSSYFSEAITTTILPSDPMIIQKIVHGLNKSVNACIQDDEYIQLKSRFKGEPLTPNLLYRKNIYPVTRIIKMINQPNQLSSTKSMVSNTVAPITPTSAAIRYNLTSSNSFGNLKSINPSPRARNNANADTFLTSNIVSTQSLIEGTDSYSSSLTQSSNTSVQDDISDRSSVSSFQSEVKSVYSLTQSESNYSVLSTATITKGSQKLIGKNGQEIVNEENYTFDVDLNLKPMEAKSLVLKSGEDPTLLLGWQVIILIIIC